MKHNIYDCDLLIQVGICGGWIAFTFFVEFAIAWLWIKFIGI